MKTLSQILVTAYFDAQFEIAKKQHAQRANEQPVVDYTIYLEYDPEDTDGEVTDAAGYSIDFCPTVSYNEITRNEITAKITTFRSEDTVDYETYVEDACTADYRFDISDMWYTDVERSIQEAIDNCEEQV